MTAPVPTVGGIAKVGQLQTANAGTWAPTGATLSYQWYRGTAAIVGAVSRTYTTTALDYGKTLKVRVRAAKSGYITLDRYSAARSIAAGTIAATKSLTVSGTHRYERTVKVSQGWTAGSTIRYQWYRNGVAIRGGTGYALYLNSGYIGARVNVKVTVSKAGYTTRSATTPAITVGKALITLKTAPRITGATSLGFDPDSQRRHLRAGTVSLRVPVVPQRRRDHRRSLPHIPVGGGGQRPLHHGPRVRQSDLLRYAGHHESGAETAGLACDGTSW